MLTRPATLVMAKAPRAGLSKTRLVPFLSAERAASLAAAFLTDAVALARSVTPDVILAYAPPDARYELLPGDDSLIRLAQHGATLGDRLAHAAAEAAARGFAPLLITGTDSPTLPREHLRSALAALTSGAADLALGGTEDGGYYLIGARHSAVPSFGSGLFDGVAWSTGNVYEQTAANARRLGLRLFDAPAWYDVDTPDDLLRLRAELTHAGARRRAPATARWFDAHSFVFDPG